VLLEESINLSGMLGVCLLAFSPELHRCFFYALLLLHLQLPHLRCQLSFQRGDSLKMLCPLLIGLMLNALPLCGRLLE
jgi:hypothetical protein